MKQSKLIIYVLIIAFILRLLFLFDYHEVWWDSAVYIGMGKYIFSLAQQGLWEPIRPIVWPLILGLIWKINLDPVLFGNILTTILSLAITYLTFLIAKDNFDERTGIIASILVAFSSLIFFFNFRGYTEIPALFFILLSLFFIFKQRYFLGGAFVSVAFLTKFPAGLFLICFIPLVFSKEKLRNIFYYGMGFFVVLIPYLIFNYFMYGNILFPFVSASDSINNVAGCNYLRYHPWYYYFIFIIKDNFLNIFSVLGVYFTTKKMNKKNITLLLSFFIPLFYLMQMNCREDRYIIMFIPFLAILSAKGIIGLVEMSAKKQSKKYYIISFIIVLLISSILAVYYYSINEQTVKIVPIEEFYHFVEGKEIKGEIWTTNPLVNLYVSKKLELLYYPLYTTQGIIDFELYLKTEDIESTQGIIDFEKYTKTADIEYIFLDTCGGGMTCSKGDENCNEKTISFISDIKMRFNQAFYKRFGECDYYVFRRK
jgi:hypothetical protein